MAHESGRPLFVKSRRDELDMGDCILSHSNVEPAALAKNSNVAEVTFTIPEGPEKGFRLSH